MPLGINTGVSPTAKPWSQTRTNLHSGCPWLSGITIDCTYESLPFPFFSHSNLLTKEKKTYHKKLIKWIRVWRRWSLETISAVTGRPMGHTLNMLLTRSHLKPICNHNLTCMCLYCGKKACAPGGNPTQRRREHLDFKQKSPNWPEGSNLQTSCSANHSTTTRKQAGFNAEQVD